MVIGKQYRAALFAGAALSLIATLASAAEWRLVDMTGQVRIAVPGGAPAAGRLNQTLPIGSSVTTAGGGRATLDNGEQRIVVAPNSRLTVQPEAGGFTRIAQDLGAAMFKVDKRAAPHFRVDTPLLAAIVKGTTFTVMVEGTSDAVSVAEGLVEVRSNLNAGIGSDVGAGATGTVMRDAPGAVQLVSPASAPSGPAPEAVNIVPIDYGAASDGLIDVAPPVAQGGQDMAAIRAVVAEPSNNTVGASVQDSPSVAAGGSAIAAVSQIASLEAGQRETATQLASVAGLANGNNGQALGVAGNGNGNGNNGNGNGNGGSAAGVAGPAASNDGAGPGNGNANSAANGNSGNGPGNPGPGNGNGPPRGPKGNNGNGNGPGNPGPGNGPPSPSETAANGNAGNGNGPPSGPHGNGNGPGNPGPGNGNGPPPPGEAAANGNAGSANGPAGGPNGNNGNGNGGGPGVVEPVVTAVVDTATGLLGGLTGNGNSGNGNAGNGNAGNGNTGNGNGNSGG